MKGKYFLVVGAFVAISGVCLLRTHQTGRQPSSIENHPGEEVIAPDETQSIDQIRAMIRQQVTEQATRDKIAHRDAHAKAHGCVRAEFKVDEISDPRFKSGIFATPQTYQAWIRFSNGDPKIQGDWIPDGRGMAIKVMGVQGEKVLDSEKNEATQDFLMINNPTFFVKTLKDYVQLQSAMEKAERSILSGALPFAEFVAEGHLQEVEAAMGILVRKVDNPLQSRYWSMTPYRLGSEIIKFSAAPCVANNNSAFTSRDGANFLSHNLLEELRVQEACFDLKVQRRIGDMSVEDSVTEWSEAASPFVKVATIVIPKLRPGEDFTSTTDMGFCENLSMTPWHSLPEHQPLGGVNRARKVIYEEISTLRHQLNHQPRAEPTSW